MAARGEDISMAAAVGDLRLSCRATGAITSVCVQSSGFLHSRATGERRAADVQPISIQD
jgi:hypothetical protein